MDNTPSPKKLKFKDRVYRAIARPSRHPDGRPTTPPEVPELKVEMQESPRSNTFVEEFKSNPFSKSSIEIAHVDGRVFLKSQGLILSQYKITQQAGGWKLSFDLESTSANVTPSMTPQGTPTMVHRQLYHKIPESPRHKLHETFGKPK